MLITRLLAALCEADGKPETPVAAGEEMLASGSASRPFAQTLSWYQIKMAMIHVAAERVVPSSAEVAYGYLADMHEHERFLPPAFSNFSVEQGGVGAGSVVTFTVTAGGRSRPYRMTVSEPMSGMLVETDANSSLVTTFTVAAHGEAALVNIATTWRGAGGLGGFFERRFAPKVMKKLYEEELERFSSFLRDRASESAKVDEASEESFPASDPPAY